MCVCMSVCECESVVLSLWVSGGVYHTLLHHSNLQWEPLVLAEGQRLFSNAEDAKQLRNRADKTNLI